MNGNPRVPPSPGARSDAPTVIGAACAQILLPGKDKRPSIALIMPSICGMSATTGGIINAAIHVEAIRNALRGNGGQKRRDRT